MPDQPYSPNTPVFWGTKGVRLSVFIYLKPIAINANTTIILSATIKSLNLELPAVPRMRINESTTTSKAAGTLKTPPSAGQAVHSIGRGYPISVSIILKYLLHEMAMATDATAYSSTRSQPIIHATSSPIVK